MILPNISMDTTPAHIGANDQESENGLADQLSLNTDENMLNERALCKLYVYRAASGDQYNTLMVGKLSRIIFVFPI